QCLGPSPSQPSPFGGGLMNSLPRRGRAGVGDGNKTFSKEEVQMADAVIVSTARTPIGKAFRGIFNDTHAADMGAHVIKHAAERAKVELGEIEDVILGCAAPEGTTGSNVA